MQPGESRKGPVLDIVLPLASVAVRFVAMGLCAAVLTIVLGQVSDALLPPPGSFDGAFRRLGACAMGGLVLGIALGGVLSHRFARGTYLPVERVGFAAAAAVGLLVLAGIVVIG